MHNLIGNHGAQGMANIANSGLTSGQLTASMQNSVDRSRRAMGTKKIFDGRIEVQQVANGYTVHIGLKEGYEYTTHIASSITEVNEIIAAAMVAFQLENS
jgi:hypothetical protein